MQQSVAGLSRVARDVLKVKRPPAWKEIGRASTICWQSEGSDATAWPERSSWATGAFFFVLNLVDHVQPTL